MPKKISPFGRKKIKIVNFNYLLLAALTIVLAGHYSNLVGKKLDDFFLTFFSCVATLPVLFSTYKSIKNKKISVDLLASIALLVSLINKEWASAVFINLMLTSARIFAAYTERRSQKALKSLMKLRPDRVKVKKGDKIIEESISKIKKNDLIVIESGDRIPVDGTVVSGEALIDQSSLTGESVPINKTSGDHVLSSTLNTSGSIIIIAEKVGKDTTFEKLVKLVEKSQENKVGIKTVVDKFTGWYIAITVIGALVIYFFSHNLKLVLSILLVTCADDIAVAIPMAFSAAIGNAAKKGIIVKGGEYFEGLTKVKTLLLDKTGTITQGKLKVTKVISASDFQAEDILKLAAIADCFSEHPIAKAIIEYARENKVTFSNPAQFKEFPGKGSTAVYKEKTVVCGSQSLSDQFKIKLSPPQLADLSKIKEDAGTLLFVSYDTKLVGYIELEDTLRPEVKDSITRLKSLGVRDIIMLTGDNEKVAQKISAEVGISNFHANLLPEDKLTYVKHYVDKKDGKVAMVGDGVNDAASLALSDIGIAMGAIGTDAAIEAADIALMKDDFSKIPDALSLGNLVMRISHQDFMIWGILNAAGLFLAFAGIIGPEGAAAFNFVTDFIPIFNSLRLFGN